MSVLSERDIIKELGEGIFIYPFENFNKHFSGGCLKLTASVTAHRNKKALLKSITSNIN